LKDPDFYFLALTPSLFRCTGTLLLLPLYLYQDKLCTMMRSIVTVVATLLFAAHVQAWHVPVPRRTVIRQSTSTSKTALHNFETTDNNKEAEVVESAEETTEKYGLEAGLFQSVKSGDGESAKSLLKKYGIAYLATSIPLAMVSFGLCYLLVDNGVDVASLLQRVGINENADAAEKAGTFAIAYAAHKAASPIRFPPTVLLTPVVAKLIGKEPEEDDDGAASAEE
jgi:hypothetical protein